MAAFLSLYATYRVPVCDAAWPDLTCVRSDPVFLRSSDHGRSLSWGANGDTQMSNYLIYVVARWFALNVLFVARRVFVAYRPKLEPTSIHELIKARKDSYVLANQQGPVGLAINSTGPSSKSVNGIAIGRRRA
jgi:hypothetical protein